MIIILHESTLLIAPHRKMKKLLTHLLNNINIKDILQGDDEIQDSKALQRRTITELIKKNIFKKIEKTGHEISHYAANYNVNIDMQLDLN